MVVALQAVSEDRRRKRVAVTGSGVQAADQADGDGSGLAAIAKQRATVEVAREGSTEGWRNTEME